MTISMAHQRTPNIVLTWIEKGRDTTIYTRYAEFAKMSMIIWGTEFLSSPTNQMTDINR